MNPLPPSLTEYGQVASGAAPTAYLLGMFKTWFLADESRAEHWSEVADGVLFQLYRDDFARHLLERSMLQFTSSTWDAADKAQYLNALQGALAHMIPGRS